MASMAAFLGIPQTGHWRRRESQVLHEERCLQGKQIMHEDRELQLLQIIFCSSSSWTSQQDSASSPLVDKQYPLSLSCSIVLFNDMTIASFSFAILCHASFSISIFFKYSSSSFVLLPALTISSSLCFSKNSSLDSYFLQINPSCCFFCSFKIHLNFSFCFHQKPINQ